MKHRIQLKVNQFLLYNDFFLSTISFCSSVCGHDYCCKIPVSRKKEVTTEEQNSTPGSEQNTFISFPNCVSIIMIDDLAMFMSSDLARKK